MESPGIRLIAGLGNPGLEYAQTRHNAGFRFLDALAVANGKRYQPELCFKGECVRVTLAGQDVWLLKPQTFMNHSGESVQALAHFYRIAPTQILVVHDELDLVPGSVRFKVGGGTGGHNGLADIVEKLGTKDFTRLRIGIGHPGSAAQVVSYVLKKATSAEQELIDEAMARAVPHLNELVRGEYSKVMNSLHTHKA